MIERDYEDAEQRALDLELEALLAPPKPRYALILEFPCDLDPDVVTSRLENIAVYAEDILHGINGRVVGTYEEEYL